MQFPYQSPAEWQYFQWAQNQKKNETERLKKTGTEVGLIVLGSIGMSFLIAIADIVLGMIVSKGSITPFTEAVKAMNHGQVWYLLTYLMQYVLMMGIPLLIAGILSRRRHIPLAPTKAFDPALSILMVFFGFGAISAANYCGSAILSFFESVGLSPLEVPNMQDGTWTGLVLNIIIVAVAPAILEELLFRGYVLQSLRVAGDRNALLISSFLFGLMHGTIQQIPFAFLLGLVFGYIVLKTGDIRTSMVLHFLNNGISVVLEFISMNKPESFGNTLYMIFYIVSVTLGVVGTAVLVGRFRTRTPVVGDNPSPFLTEKEKAKATIFSTGMIIFIVCMLIVTVAGSGLLEALSDFPSSSSGIPFGPDSDTASILRGLFHG